jgi:chromate transporter
MSLNRGVGEVAAVFLRLGATAFGGPAAHIAMMRTEFVERRKWLDDEAFTDLIGAANLIPGPNSTEVAIHLGHRRAGAAGLVTAGVCFILPAFLIVLGLAWLYVRFGTLPETRAALYGAKPVILAVVAQALVGLSKSVLKGPVMIGFAVAALIASLLGASELLVVFLPGLLLGGNEWRKSPSAKAGLPLLAVTVAVGGFLGLSIFLNSRSGGGPAAGPWTLFLEFLKIGSVLYGSGYVLLSYLETDLVRRLAWLSPGQLLDAVAVGQFTPGPVFTTATFVGYVAAGLPGAVAATLGIFLPSFIFVALSARALPKLRSLPTTAAFISGVNAASLGLMAAVLFKLGGDAIRDPLAGAVALAALALLLQTKVNSAWLVLAGAVLGVVFHPLAGSGR